MTTTRLQFQGGPFWTDAAETRLVAAEKAVAKLLSVLTSDKMPEAGHPDFYALLDGHLHGECKRLVAVTPDERAKTNRSLFDDLKGLLDRRKDLIEAHERFSKASSEVERQRAGLKGKTADGARSSARAAATIDAMARKCKDLWGAAPPVLMDNTPVGLNARNAAFWDAKR